MLLMIHPNGAVLAFHKGEAALAIQAYRDGYRALTERTNAALKQGA